MECGHVYFRNLALSIICKTSEVQNHIDSFRTFDNHCKSTDNVEIAFDPTFCILCKNVYPSFRFGYIQI